LEAGDLPRRKKNAINLRRGEKKILFKNYQRMKEAEKMILANWENRDMDIPDADSSAFRTKLVEQESEIL
jgi:hypothetical protein